MKKQIPCPKCDGRGYISKCKTWDYGNGLGGGQAWSENCQNCNGTGIVLAPVTNADRIRAMTDEELAEFLCNVYDEDPVDGYKFDHAKFIEGYTIPDYDEDRIKEWLQQPCGGAEG